MSLRVPRSYSKYELIEWRGGHNLSSIAALNRQFIAWVEEPYDAQLHSVPGMSPLDRFALDRSRVRFLPSNEAGDELFFVEEE
jgi:hypothetical protein